MRNCLLHGLIPCCTVPHGERCKCPVQGRVNSDIEGAFVGLLRHFSDLLAEGEIIVHGIVECTFDSVNIFAFECNEVTDSVNLSVKHLVFCGIFNVRGVSLVLQCICHDRYPSEPRQPIGFIGEKPSFCRHRDNTRADVSCTVCIAQARPLRGRCIRSPRSACVAIPDIRCRSCLYPF